MFDDFENDLPDELQGGRTRTPEPKPDDSSLEDKLADLGAAIASKREQAIRARKESGIEKIWQTCEEAYLCIDDSNRHEFAASKWNKPTSMQGPITTSRDVSDVKSNAFVSLTSRYVDMAAAKVCEITLPIDDKAFSFGPTPVPELVNAKDSTTPVMHPATGQPMMRQQPAQPGEPAQAPVQMTQGDVATEILNQAKDCAEKAEKRVWDWMIECGYAGHMRTVIHDSARIGVGVIKGPFPDVQTSKALSKTGNVAKLTIVSKSVPAAKWIDAWNLFPDGTCGEDIHSGDHIFERDFISRNTLKGLKLESDSLGQPIYIPSQIDKVLDEGPGKCNLDGANPSKLINKDSYEIWYFTGVIKKSDLKLTGAVGIDELPEELDEVFAVVTVVNDTVIRATVNPLESGDFPYHALPWSRRSGSWAGVGVGEKVSMPQRMVNAATRALLNNAGVSSGSQIVVDPVSLVPADGNQTITPLKLWHKTADATSNDVRAMFMAVDIPNQYQPLMAIIQYGMQMAEQVSGIPLISQGQQMQVEQTFGQAELQNNNANVLLRSLGLRIDNFITEPLVNGFYEMLLLDPSVPDEEKGDFKINANGTMVMVEKAIQEQTMLQAGQLTQNPAYGIDPKKWFSEYWKTKRLDPRKIQYTEEELAKMQPQPPVQIQVAQLKAQSDHQLLTAKLNAEIQQAQQDMAHEQQMLQNGQATPHMATASARIETARIAAASRESVEQARAQSELAYVQTERAIAADNAAARHQERQDQLQLEMIKYANQQKISLEQMRADLSKTQIQETTKRQLAAAEIALNQSEAEKDRAVDVHKHNTKLIADQSVIEPDGQAPAGQAFSQ